MTHGYVRLIGGPRNNEAVYVDTRSRTIIVPVDVVIDYQKPTDPHAPHTTTYERTVALIYSTGTRLIFYRHSELSIKDAIRWILYEEKRDKTCKTSKTYSHDYDDGRTSSPTSWKGDLTPQSSDASRTRSSPRMTTSLP